MNPGDILVSEVEAINYVILADITARDLDKNPNLEFFINWEKSRFEKDRRILTSISDEWKKYIHEIFFKEYCLSFSSK